MTSVNKIEVAGKVVDVSACYCMGCTDVWDALMCGMH